MKKIKLNYLIDFAFFVQFVLVGYSGLILFFYRHNASYLMWIIHEKIGILMLFFFVAHIALHWRWILFSTKKFFLGKTKIKENKVTKISE
ncbi:MAG TPA: hypothetical protein VGK06_16470 [Methanosarcina sp.]